MKKEKVKLTKKEIAKLIEKAKEGMKNAYCPIHNFPTGSAVLTTKGNFYLGCNVESVISGLGTCSERCAIDNAISNGDYKIKAIAIISPFEEPITSCGMCLQYLSEFSQISNKDIKIIRVGSKGKIIETSIEKMLPNGHGPKDLNLDLSKYTKND